MEVFRVSAKSNSNSVAGAIAGAIREQEEVKEIELQAIGAGAINQAVKAIIIARGFIAPNGIDLVCIPAFTDIQMEDEERTAVKLILQVR
ncbi:stage V sporulation protein S [Clostridiales Family XIII bacterium ASD5510]|uniref:Stage V sporulation protein S n=1 Tax=Hominibacterium faecale TaxID=2839743 RepID=A0A9J6QYA5_9FIRM|nr:stage V sporulation protein S [Hominibacterium faecale]MCU7380473.1 stage V sporulation protein S [Hominibacterium faecale]